MAYSRIFSDTEIMALAGYQLNPGHSDLDNEQPMAVRLHDGLWDHQDLRCLLGDIRQAKADVRAALSGTETLRREVESLRRHYSHHRANGERLHTSLREMNVALEPFAKIGRLYEEKNLSAPHPLLKLEPHDRAMGGPDGLTVGDFLRAAEVSLGEPDPRELEDASGDELVF